MNKLLTKYINGNYTVKIYSDGTKVRYNDLDNLTPDRPESMDIKITNKCNKGCSYCHENSTPNGCHGNLLNNPILDTLEEGTELALGGGNVLEHPDFYAFLCKCTNKKLIPSVTVNQQHFMENYHFIKTKLVDAGLIYGVGISLTDACDSEFIKCVKSIPNAVIHVINGIVSIEDLQILAHNNLKILILGYKEFRRGKAFYENNNSEIDTLKNELKTTLKTIIDEGWFKTISFDNLAIKQLDVKSIMSDKQWAKFYMGDDAQYTFYIDLVTNTYAGSSTTPVDERLPITDNLTIKQMFQNVKQKWG